MIRLATAKDLPRLKEIWQLCFGDDDAYTDMYFTHRFQPEQVMVYDEGPRVTAMLSMLPLTLRTPFAMYPAIYIYGVATHPDYTRRGICGQLLQYTHAYLKRQGIALSVLVPSSDKLFTY